MQANTYNVSWSQKLPSFLASQHGQRCMPRSDLVGEKSYVLIGRLGLSTSLNPGLPTTALDQRLKDQLHRLTMRLPYKFSYLQTSTQNA